MLRFVQLLFVFFCLSQRAQAGNWWGIDYSAFAVKPHLPGSNLGSLYEKQSSIQGSYWAITRSFPLSRMAGFTLGAGYNKTSYQKETQGIFPETAQYGFVSVNGLINYWTFPVSVAIISNGPNRGYKHYRAPGYQLGIRLMYIPCFLHHSGTWVTALGGAQQSAYYNNYKSDEKPSLHKVVVCITNQLHLGRKAKILADPYIGFSSPHFQSGGRAFNDITYGIKLSFHLQMPQVSLEWERSTKNEEKKKRLEEKQKEIEEQLKQKPK